MFRRSVWHRLLLFSALIIVPVPAFAAPSLSISSPSADGTFVLRGEQMAGVAGLDVRISYDSSTLSNPRVTMGSLVTGMMNAANPTNPIRMAMVGTKPIGGSGSGIVATITFDRIGTSPGVITALTGSLIDGNGKKLAMSLPAISNPVLAAAESTPTTPPGGGGGSVDTGSTDDNVNTTNTMTTTTTANRRPFVAGGTLTLPDQESQPGEKNQTAAKTAQLENPEGQLEPGDTLRAPEGDAVAPEDGRAPQEEKAPQPLTQPKPVISVVERFRQFEGARTVRNLTALFKTDPAAPVTQIPALAIADGKATVTLLIAVETGERAPNFAFNGSRYVSLSRGPEGGWEVEVKPDKGAVKASVTMLYNGYTQEFPLTVTPRAELVTGKPRQVTEADFQHFLKERGNPALPKFDLNRDGRRDYLDDYIFSANYLVQMEEQANKKQAGK